MTLLLNLLPWALVNLPLLVIAFALNMSLVETIIVVFNPIAYVWLIRRGYKDLRMPKSIRGTLIELMKDSFTDAMLLLLFMIAYNILFLGHQILLQGLWPVLAVTFSALLLLNVAMLVIVRGVTWCVRRHYQLTA